jgi:hypothetical protein
VHRRDSHHVARSGDVGNARGAQLERRVGPRAREGAP